MQRLLTAIVFFAAACSQDQVGSVRSAVRNGVESGLYEKSVFLQHDAQKGAECTGTNVRYSRCIVSAGHCILGGAKNKTYYAGTRPLENPTASKNQPVELGRATFNTEDLEEPDLAVYWLKGLKTSNTQARLEFPEDYEAVRIIQPSGGKLFGSVSVVQTGKHKNPRKWNLSPEQNFNGSVYGYGMLDDNESTAGIKRFGAPFIVALYPTLLRLQPDNQGRIQCFHDSGAPVLFGGLAAVTSFGIDKHGKLSTVCSDITDTFSTTFSPAAYEWTSDTMEDLCTQWLNVKIEGEGSVAGGTLPQQRVVIGIKNNSMIECVTGNGGDCIENLHQAGDGQNAQMIEITATPEPGWRFSHWRSESPKKKCQCDGSGDPSCTVEQPPLGYYTKDESIDEDTCIAVFTKDPPPNDGGDGGDADDADASDAGDVDGG